MTYQKSEMRCWCGESIDVMGSQEAVELACKNFRLYHGHERPLPFDTVTLGQQIAPGTWLAWRTSHPTDTFIATRSGGAEQ